MSTNDIQVGDIVRIGKGKTEYTVTGFAEFKNSTGQVYATLQPLVGYTNASATPDRLTVVTKAAAS